MDEPKTSNTAKFSKEDLILHPLRMRIILAAASRSEFTAQDLVGELIDTPQATLYRNINILADAGILNVVREQRQRNTLEKVYSLSQEKVVLTKDDLENATSTDLMRQFTVYLGILLGFMGRYLEQNEKPDFEKDHVGYTLATLNLSEEETAALMGDLQKAILPYMNNQPSPQRKRQALAIASIPDQPKKNA